MILLRSDEIYRLCLPAILENVPSPVWLCSVSPNSFGNLGRGVRALIRSRAHFTLVSLGEAFADLDLVVPALCQNPCASGQVC